MVARVLRSMLADEVVDHGGVKLGMIGTGGRTYRHYSRGSGPVCCRCFFLTRVVALLLLTWAVVMVIVSESSLSSATHCVDRASTEAVSLPQTFDASNDDDKRGDQKAENAQTSTDLRSQFGNRLIHISSSNPSVIPPLLADSFFGLRMHRDIAVAHREVEFCQWQEIQHTSRVRVGRDPSCQADDQSDMCDVYRTDVSFSYIKGWHSQLINSMFFDNPVAYHNPHRVPVTAQQLTPAPAEGKSAVAGRICLVRVSDSECIHAAPNEMATGLMPSERLLFDETTFSNLRHVSRKRSTSNKLADTRKLDLSEEEINAIDVDADLAGFTEWDKNYIYSRQPATRGGWAGDAAYAALSYFVDGVVGFEGPTSMFCTPGDVRVHYSVRRLGLNGVSLVGELRPRDLALVPFLCDVSESNRKKDAAAGLMILAYPKYDLSLDELLGVVLNEARKSAWWYRVVSALLSGLALVLIYFSCKPRGDNVLSGN